MNMKEKAAELGATEYLVARERMVLEQLCRRGIGDEGVLRAMRSVPRHAFVPESWGWAAYADEPLPIGDRQTISQPYMVALMTAALRLSGQERVLEVGTGSGYQAAVLAEICKEVHSVELRPELASLAKQRLEQLGYKNVYVHCGDGSLGLEEFAPFDAILVSAAAPAVPAPLLRQLADGGRLAVPVGTEEHQCLLCTTRRGEEYRQERRESCRFVPLLGCHGWTDS
jgi:protein-L-isoaspartate(D-aspartate) O-methyltransferase